MNDLVEYRSAGGFEKWRVNSFRRVEQFGYSSISGTLLEKKRLFADLTESAYWVIEDSQGIYDFINTELRREWEEDAIGEDRDPKEDAWLKRARD